MARANTNQMSTLQSLAALEQATEQLKLNWTEHAFLKQCANRIRAFVDAHTPKVAEKKDENTAPELENKDTPTKVDEKLPDPAQTSTDKKDS